MQVEKGKDADDTIYAPPVDSDEHKKLLAEALSMVRSAEDKHRKVIPDWVDNYNAFMTQPTSRSPVPENDWQSNVRTPYIAEQVLTMLPRIVEGRPTVDVLKNDSSISDDIVRAQKQYLRNVIHQDNFAYKSSLWGLSNILFGIGWSKQSWLYSCKKRSYRDRITGELNSKKIVVNNRPTMDIGHPFDVMPDPLAYTLDNARFVVWRTVVSKQRIIDNKRELVTRKDGSKEWQGRYYNTEHVHEVDSNQREYRLFDEPNENSIYEAHLNEKTRKRVEILEIFDNEKDRLIVIANRKVVLRSQKMPWWHCQMPVSAMVTTPSLGSMTGVAEAYWMVPIQEHLQMIENRRLDNTLLQMDSVLLINERVFDKDDFQTAPGAKWAVSRSDDVVPLQHAQPQLYAAQDLAELRGRLQSIIGTAYMTGGENSGMNQDTASGLLSIIEEGNRRVDYRMNLARVGYERALQQMLSLGAQYLEDVTYVPGDSRSKDPLPVSPDDLARDTSVRVTLGSETGMKSLKQQMAQNLLQSAAVLMGTEIPTSSGNKVFNPYPIIEAMADAYDKDPEDFLTEMQAVQQATAPTDPVASMAAQQESSANPGVVF